MALGSLLVLSSVGIINSGIFTEAPATVTLHWMLGFQLAVLPLVVACAIAGWQLRRVSGWRGYGWYSLITAGGIVALTLLSFAFFSPASPVLGAHIGGVIERVLALVVFAWDVVVGWRLFVLAGSHQVAEAPADHEQETLAMMAEGKEDRRTAWREF